VASSHLQGANYIHLYSDLIATENGSNYPRQSHYRLRLKAHDPARLVLLLQKYGQRPELKNGIIKLQLGPLQLKEKPNKYLHATVFVDYYHIFFTEIKRQITKKWGKYP